jgi:ABC-type polysaccharide/polyol phosphate export permease
MVAVLEGARWSLVGTAAPTLLQITYSFAVIVVVFAIGALVLGRKERWFADVI